MYVFVNAPEQICAFYVCFLRAPGIMGSRAKSIIICMHIVTPIGGFHRQGVKEKGVTPSGEINTPHESVMVIGSTRNNIGKD